MKALLYKDAMVLWKQMKSMLLLILVFSVLPSGFQNTFAVYGRGGQKCKTCGSLLEKAKVAGRSTVFCPQCQH